MPVSKNSSCTKQLPPRLRELQVKIHDEKYIDYAVERIALVVSRRIVEKHTSGRSAEKTY
ncbi:MAG: hypothetical protein ILP07_10660 [Treponema sp.]|nr:hypothetical protein [Treponema sp.]MBR6296817.1 hypothetical protein [Treponema sp.]MEE3314568.1 hypothetical protein [Treponema sp.]